MLIKRPTEKSLYIPNFGLRVKKPFFLSQEQTFLDYLIDTVGFNVVWPLTDVTDATVTAYPDSTFNGTQTGWVLQDTVFPGDDSGLAPRQDNNTDFANLFTTEYRDIFLSTKAFSVILFLKATALSSWSPSPPTRLWQNRDSGGEGLDINIQTSGFIRCRINLNGINYFADVPAIHVNNTLDWACLIATFKENDTFKAYFNGIERASTPTVAVTTFDDMELNILGNTVPTQTLAWRGSMAFAGFINRQLTSTEVQDIVDFSGI